MPLATDRIKLTGPEFVGGLVPLPQTLQEMYVFQVPEPSACFDAWLKLNPVVRLLADNAGLPEISNKSADPAPPMANTSPDVRSRVTESSLLWPVTDDTVTVPKGPQPVHVFPDCRLPVYITVSAIAGEALNIAAMPNSATVPIDLKAISLFISRPPKPML